MEGVSRGQISISRILIDVLKRKADLARVAN